MKPGFYPAQANSKIKDIDLSPLGEVVQVFNDGSTVFVAGSEDEFDISQFDFGPNPQPLELPEWTKKKVSKAI